ncbi:MAG: ParB/RepB/Spo0J family partition protein [Bacteroidota bacterium]
MATRKAALGKGLGSLLPQMEEAQDADQGDGASEDGTLAQARGPQARLYNFEERFRTAGRVAELEVDAIRPNPYQPRTEFNERALRELAASIEQLGIIQPLTVRSLGGGQFELISGERRLRAARKAGLKRVPAFVREADTEAMLEMAIVENVQREDLNPIEIALGYQRLIDEIGLTQEQVADKVGKSRSGVTNLLRLLRLPPRVQASIRDGLLTPGHARMLVSLGDDEIQMTLHQAILDEGLSVRDVEERVRAYKNPTPEPENKVELAVTAVPTLDERNRLQIADFEAKLREHLATQVRLQHRADHSGKIEIAYYSQEDLERVLDLVLGKK